MKGAPVHIVLPGDSVFDNAAYVGGGPDVVAQLRERLGSGGRATLLAIDGAVTREVPAQLARLPAYATHLVVSVGGNDALRQSGILAAPVRSVAESLLKLADIQRALAANYAAMLDAVARAGLPVAMCTIYDPRFPDPTQRVVSTIALAVFNDVIVRQAIRRSWPVLDLRLVCDEDSDFANPIEPSTRGGAKIAAAILSVMSRHDWSGGRSAVFAR